MRGRTQAEATLRATRRLVTLQRFGLRSLAREVTSVGRLAPVRITWVNAFRASALISDPGAPGSKRRSRHPGHPGQKGDPGVSGYQMVYGTWLNVAYGQFATGSTTCPVGKKALGGGLDTSGGDPRLEVVYSSPWVLSGTSGFTTSALPGAYGPASSTRTWPDYPGSTCSETQPAGATAVPGRARLWRALPAFAT